MPWENQVIKWERIGRPSNSAGDKGHGTDTTSTSGGYPTQIIASTLTEQLPSWSFTP